MLQIPSALLLQYKACSKAQQLSRGAGQLQPIKEGRQGCRGQVRGQRVQGAAEPKHTDGGPVVRMVGSLGAQGPACWGTDPCGLP